RHHEVLELMAKVHELGDDIEGFSAREDQVDPVEHIFGRELGLEVDGGQCQLYQGNAQQDPKGTPDRLGVECCVCVVVCRRCLIRHINKLEDVRVSRNR